MWTVELVYAAICKYQRLSEQVYAVVYDVDLAQWKLCYANFLKVLK